MVRSVITTQNVSISFGNKPILQNISLQLAEAQTHVLLGTSGSGKSTLLRLMMGLLEADAGTINLGDLTVNSETQPLIAEKVGYVIQEGGLFPHLTAYDNVSLVPKLRGWDENKIRNKMEFLADLVNLHEGLLDRFPRELSGGQQQRLGIMRSLIMDPDYIFMDEPLGALDPLVRADIQVQLKGRIFKELRKTVVMVTHNIAEAAIFGHTVTLLSEGRVVQHGSFGDLAHSPQDQFVTDFLTSQRPPEELKAYL